MPTRPKPWIATRARSSGSFAAPAAAITQRSAPRAVALLRPRVPPTAIGLPITEPGMVWPRCIEKVSIIQAMVCDPVFTSGAGMSFSGPSRMPISVANRRVNPWRSFSLSRRGLTRTPPAAPPNGMRTSAAFQVFSIARARTSSRSRFGT